MEVIHKTQRSFVGKVVSYSILLLAETHYLTKPQDYHNVSERDRERLKEMRGSEEIIVKKSLLRDSLIANFEVFYTV